MQILGRHRYRLCPSAHGQANRNHDCNPVDSVVPGIGSADVRMEGPRVGQKTGKLRVLGVAGHRLSDLRDGFELLRAAAGHLVPLLAHLSRRAQADSETTTGKYGALHPILLCFHFPSLV
jgi:hypothetical protein